MTWTAKITTLIAAPDNAEVIRDRIAEILLVESARQQELAADREIAVAYTRAMLYEVVDFDCSEAHWDGTSEPTIHGGAEPDGVYSVKWLCTATGAVGTGGVKYKLSTDGGETYGAETALGTADHIHLTQIGNVVLDFTAGSIIAGDYLTFSTEAASLPSDYTVEASEDDGHELETGAYVVTAGTLADGAGEWTALAPSGAHEHCTTVSGGDALEFPTLGLTLTVTIEATAWLTGDVITATVAEVKDPLQWKLRVFTEASMPFGEWLAAPPQDADAAVPIVCVAYDSGTYDEKASNVFSRQRLGGRYHVDCYGYGISTETDAGHDPGDVRASFEAARARRLARNILMAAHCTYLGLQGTVARRFIESDQRFQPQIDQRDVQNVVGFRLVLRVDFNEFSPQVEGQPCEAITCTMKRSPDGEVFLTQQYAF